MRDKYLHTNCLAALANMSAQFRDLHPYVSQRLVSLFETLAKRYQKLQAKINGQEPVENKDVNVTIVPEVGADTEQDIVVLEEVLRMVLEIFNSSLSTQLKHNPNLVYTLLYKRQVFEPFKKNPAFKDIVANLEVVIEYFSDLLKSKSQQYEVDAQQVLTVIQQGAKDWPKEKLTVRGTFLLQLLILTVLSMYYHFILKKMFFSIEISRSKVQVRRGRTAGRIFHSLRLVTSPTKFHAQLVNGDFDNSLLTKDIRQPVLSYLFTSTCVFPLNLVYHSKHCNYFSCNID